MLSGAGMQPATHAGHAGYNGKFGDPAAKTRTKGDSSLEGKYSLTVSFGQQYVRLGNSNLTGNRIC